MRRSIILLITVLSLAQPCFSQQKVLAKFIIQTAEKNHIDVTPQYAQSASYFVFYVTEEKKPYFASVMDTQESQSYGEIVSIQHTSTPETNKLYASDTYRFKWQYSNSYDSHQGLADVVLVKVNKPGGIAFRLKIVPETLELLEYTGYMEGSLNLD